MYVYLLEFVFNVVKDSLHTSGSLLCMMPEALMYTIIHVPFFHFYSTMDRLLPWLVATVILRQSFIQRQNCMSALSHLSASSRVLKGVVGVYVLKVVYKVYPNRILYKPANPTIIQHNENLPQVCIISIHHTYVFTCLFHNTRNQHRAPEQRHGSRTVVVVALSHTVWLSSSSSATLL